MNRSCAGWVVGLAIASLLVIVLNPGFEMSVGLIWGLSLAGLLIAVIIDH
jgi:hypothetical protein